MIKTSSLSYHYHGGQTISYPPIDCSSPDPLLILGESGSGKTTLLHLLAGLMRPSNGTIDIEGVDITQLSAKALDQFRGQNIGIIFQQNHFVAALTVLENLTLAQKLSNTPVNPRLCQSYLNKLMIADVANRRTDQLSQGQRQRVAIARALVNQPSIILADEPTSALDDTTCNQVISLLEEQATASDAQLIIVTHDTRLKERYKQQIILDSLVASTS